MIVLQVDSIPSVGPDAAAPKIFTVAFSILQPFLHEVTINKIRVFGCDSDVWKSALLEEIDASQLPAQYGGTLDDPSINQVINSNIPVNSPMTSCSPSAAGDRRRAQVLLHDQ
jgi:hypothetical protein